jgi:hypothetical protein
MRKIVCLVEDGAVSVNISSISVAMSSWWCRIAAICKVVARAELFDLVRRIFEFRAVVSAQKGVDRGTSHSPGLKTLWK